MDGIPTRAMNGRDRSCFYLGPWGMCFVGGVPIFKYVTLFSLVMFIYFAVFLYLRSSRDAG